MSESSKPVTEPADADGEATRIYVPDSPGGPAPGQFPGYPTSSSKGLTPGQVLGYTYRIERLLARGGMGAVYRARHVDLGSVHAIKVILPELAEDPRTISLFQEEANKLRRLRHDAIVSYEGLFRDEGGARYLVMEFVDGPSLAHVLKSGPLPLSELRQLRDRCAAGLAAAHAKGIIHRDISPDNIILVDGRADLAKIIDFGIAKSTNPGDLTILGQEFAGKYAYVSPEQLGMIESPVDARSDIYSLGLVLAAAAIGRPLDIGGGYLRAIEARRRPLDLTGVPDAFRAEIAAMVDPDPTRRPASLQGYEAAERDGATIAPVAIPVRSAPRGSNLLAIFGAVTLFSLLGVGGAWLYRQVPHAEHDEVPTTASTPPTTAQPVPLPAARDASLGLPPPLPHQAESALAPGQSLRDCPDCPELIIVPAGEFQMGDPSLPVASPVRQIRRGIGVRSQLAYSGFRSIGSGSGGQDQLERCPTLRPLAESEDWKELSAAALRRMGMGGARRWHYRLFLGRRSSARQCRLRRLRFGVGRPTDGSGCEFPAERLRSLRHEWECLAMGPGLLDTRS